MKSGLLIPLLIFLAFPQSATAAGTSEKKPAPKWAEKMRELERTFQTLLVDLSSDERFNDRANRKRIEDQAERISKLAHDVKVAQKPDTDPTLGIIAGQFASETKHAYRALMTGSREYAREVLRTIPGYCISCHTRNGSGPQFSVLSKAEAPAGLKGMALADFYTSTRQFDRALEEYQRQIQEGKAAESRPFEWEKAIRTALSISIRVKKDPEQSLKIVEQVLKEPRAPFFTVQKAEVWKKNILDWKKEGVQTPVTAEGLYATAVRLTAEAKAQQRFPADRSADVLYLRASSVIHELLGQPSDPTRGAEALYLAGFNYEVLRDLNLGEIHDFYYLACILKSPHSEIAKVCFGRYQESVQFAFTGSSGTLIPGEVMEKLKQLEKLANPEGQSENRKKVKP